MLVFVYSHMRYEINFEFSFSNFPDIDLYDSDDTAICNESQTTFHVMELIELLLNWMPLQTHATSSPIPNLS